MTARFWICWRQEGGQQVPLFREVDTPWARIPAVGEYVHVEEGELVLEVRSVTWSPDGSVDLDLGALGPEEHEDGLRWLSRLGYKPWTVPSG